MNAKLIALVTLLVVSCISAPAKAACAPGDITGISFAPSATLSPYNPFASFSPKLVTVTVSASVSCTIELAVFSPTLPARMTGPAQLTYDVTGGAASLVFASGSPPVTVPIVIPGPGNPGTTTVEIDLPAGQVVADGAYSDGTLMAQVFDKTGSAFTLLQSQSMPVSGSVAKVCQFTGPTSPTLSFTSAIANGLPNPAYQQSVTFNGVSCTAPTIVRLSGAALQLQPGAARWVSIASFIIAPAQASMRRIRCSTPVWPARLHRSRVTRWLGPRSTAQSVSTSTCWLASRCWPGRMAPP